MQTKLVGYLQVSGYSEDLARFETELFRDRTLQKRLGISAAWPLPWKGYPRILFRVNGSREFHEGILPMPDKAPVLVEKPFAIKPGQMPRQENARHPVAAGARAKGIQFPANRAEGDIAAQVGRVVGNVARFILSRLRDFDSFNPPPPELVEKLEGDLRQRTLKLYSFETLEGIGPQQVLANAFNYVKQNRNKFPSLLLDRKTLVKTCGGNPSPVDAPVPDEAIPEPEFTAEDYLTQEYLGRVGLEVQRDEAGNILKDDKGFPRYNIHDRARGAETTIVVIDTAPRYGVDTVDDWSSVDAYIDLKPEERVKNTPLDFKPKDSKAQKYHGLMVANLCKLVAPDARIILVRALDDDGLGNTDAIVQIMSYLVRSAPGKVTYNDLSANVENATLRDEGDEVWLPEGTRIIFNMSLTLYNTSNEDVEAPNLLKAIDDLTMKAALFVCAAGNASTLGVPRAPDEPAAYGFYPGYSHEDYMKLEARQLHEEPPSNGPLIYDPYNMVIGVAGSAQRARYLYSGFSNASPIAAPSAEIVLDSGCELELPDVERQEIYDRALGQNRKIFVYDSQTNAHIPKIAPDPSTDAPQPVMAKARYVRWSGTSFATPFVTGQAALLLGQRVDNEGTTAHPTEVKERIWLTATHPRWWNRPSEINIADSL